MKNTIIQNIKQKLLEREPTEKLLEAALVAIPKAFRKDPRQLQIIEAIKIKQGLRS